MEENYNNWNIKYQEESETFIATDKNDNTLRSKKLKELKKKIDKFGFKRIPVIYRGHRGDFFLGEITSIGIDRWDDSEFWISYTDKDGEKNRVKCDLNKICKHTAENLKKIKEINQLMKKKNTLEGKIDQIREKLEVFNKQDFENGG